jgi:hypothetical protein
MVDLQTSMLAEVQTVRDDTNRQFRENTRALKDAVAEVSNMCDDVTRQIKALIAATKARSVDTYLNFTLWRDSNSLFSGPLAETMATTPRRLGFVDTFFL